MSAMVVRFSEFLGIGYFGDERQSVIAPIFDSRRNAERGWARVVNDDSPFHAVFVEHESKYEFIAYPLEINADKINYVLYRSFSSLGSLSKFKNIVGGRTFIKFGWHDLTKPEEFDVMPDYAVVDGVDFLVPVNIKPGTLVDTILRNEL